MLTQRNPSVQQPCFPVHPERADDISSIIFIDTKISLKNLSKWSALFWSRDQISLVLKWKLRIGDHFRKKKRMCPSAGFADQPKNTDSDHTRLHLDLSGIIGMPDQTAGLSAAAAEPVQWNGIYHIIIIGLAQKITRRDLYCNHPFYPLSRSAELLQTNLKLLCQSSKGIFPQMFQSLKSLPL